MTEQQPTPAEKRGSARALWLGVQLAWDLGWIIALPVVILGLGGAYLDKYVGSSPLFILLGFILAITLSFIGIKRKLKDILQKRF